MTHVRTFREAWLPPAILKILRSLSSLDAGDLRTISGRASGCLREAEGRSVGRCGRLRGALGCNLQQTLPLRRTPNDQ